MPARMRRVALTGGIATGKSYCLRRFAELGAATIDADTLAREAVAPGSPGLAAVVDLFGARVLTPNGQLDRPALGRIVFADAEAREALETIVHPAVYVAIQRWFLACEARTPPPPAAIAEIPLLFETGRETDFDVVVVAACPEAGQIARVQARDSLSEAEARQRLTAQLPIDEKARRADFVVDTSGTEADTDADVQRVWEALVAGGEG